MNMTSKQRLIAALEHRPTDRLPVTTHHLMPYYLEKYENGMEPLAYHKAMGFDPIVWPRAFYINQGAGEYREPVKGLVCTPDWRIEVEELSDPQYRTFRYTIHTPKRKLTTVLQENRFTSWVKEHLLKDKRDMELIERYAPRYRCDKEAINRIADEVGEEALVRGSVISFPPFGQPGCFQDLACLFGIQELILESFDDPEWVKYACSVLQEGKKEYIRSLEGARYDLIELGGGDASSTVISPAMLREFVIPFDQPLIQLLHECGQRVTYHTCGGMMPILEDLAGMGPDALETFTPPAMGADVNLAEAKRRIGDKVCMIGGFDQGHYFMGCSEEETRKAVRRCFEEAGAGGGYILCPSDHFFDGEHRLVKAFVEEAHRCVYPAADCPCPSTECENHGHCAACRRHHEDEGVKPPYCQR